MQLGCACLVKRKARVGVSVIHMSTVNLALATLDVLLALRIRLVVTVKMATIHFALKVGLWAQSRGVVQQVNGPTRPAILSQRVASLDLVRLVLKILHVVGALALLVEVLVCLAKLRDHFLTHAQIGSGTHVTIHNYYHKHNCQR